jgi:hypothetical protein
MRRHLISAQEQIKNNNFVRRQNSNVRVTIRQDHDVAVADRRAKSVCLL